MKAARSIARARMTGFLWAVVVVGLYKTKIEYSFIWLCWWVVELLITSDGKEKGKGISIS